ncbi:hypothetical protein [Streptococcus merionis]|nr:hypothetical protein [Streptococcus merionis]
MFELSGQVVEQQIRYLLFSFIREPKNKEGWEFFPSLLIPYNENYF